MTVRNRLFVLLALLTAISFMAVPAFSEEAPPQGAQNWYDNLFFRDKSYAFEFIRMLGAAPRGGSDIGECIAAARLIREGDDDSWYEEWKKQADRLSDLADRWEREGHHISARDAWLRACNYYRAASFYMVEPEKRPLAIEAWKKSRSCFLRAIAGLSHVKPVKIPYENTTLPGYYISCPFPQKKHPLLIIQTGFDGTKEELFFTCAQGARERGYDCLLFEGPGQGEALRLQNLYFRPDWEHVITPVVDFACAVPRVDRERIALMGISFGGYFAPRAAAFEHRLKACIANGGIYSYRDAVYRTMPPDFAQLIDTDPETFNSELMKYVANDPNSRWSTNNALWTFGVRTPAEYYKKTREYTLEGVADKIRCHMLVIHSQEDLFFQGQPQKLYEALKCPRDLYVFTREETAQAHCQMGAQAFSDAIILNWLDGVMGEK